MDQEPGIRTSGLDLVENLVERHLAELEIAEVEPQDEERGRHPTGHRDLERLQLVAAELFTSDHYRPVTRSHACSVGQHCVAPLNIRIRME